VDLGQCHLEIESPLCVRALLERKTPTGFQSDLYLGLEGVFGSSESFQTVPQPDMIEECQLAAQLSPVPDLLGC